VREAIVTAVSLATIFLGWLVFVRLPLVPPLFYRMIRELALTYSVYVYRAVDV
jgi:hypothetical protein